MTGVQTCALPIYAPPADRWGVRGLLLGGDRRRRPAPSVLPMLWAMAAGRPVVAEAHGGTMWILGDAEATGAGMLVPPADVSRAAEGIARFHDDRSVAERTGELGRRVVEGRFHVSAFCVRLRDAWTRLVEDRPVHVASHADPDVVEWFDRSGTRWVDTRGEREHEHEIVRPREPGER